jgi:hypothetical protein
VHGTPLLYAPASCQRACQDPGCIHAHGLKPERQRRRGLRSILVILDECPEALPQESWEDNE